MNYWELLKWIGIFVVSLAVLIKSSDFFTEAAEKIGLMLGIPSFIVGVTIVSVGTSLPELITSIFSVVNNASEIVPGNVIGSNVANVCLILGVGAVFGKKLKIDFDVAKVDLPILLGASFLVVFLMCDNIISFSGGGEGFVSLGGNLALAEGGGLITRGEGLLLVLGYVIYLLYTLSPEARHGGAGDAERPPLQFLPFLILLLSSAGIFFGAKYTVVAVEEIAAIARVGKEIIAVTAVALGTSLPELAVTISAVKKKNAEMVVGNVLGSNIFNILAVGGIAGIIGDLVVPYSLIIVTIPIFLISTFLFVISIMDRTVTRWEGYVLLLFYGLSIAKTFGWF